MDRDKESEDWKSQNKRENKNKNDDLNAKTPFRVTNRKGNLLRNPPKTSVILIKEGDSGQPIAEILKIARTKINLYELGLEKQTTLRKAANGGTLIEIRGENTRDKANLHSIKLKEVLPAGTHISVLTINAAIKIYNFDVSITIKNIEDAITLISGCLTDELTIGEKIKTRNDMNAVWVKCPLAVAHKLAENKTINLGWSMAKIDVQERNKIQCFKC